MKSRSIEEEKREQKRERYKSERWKETDAKGSERMRTEKDIDGKNDEMIYITV